MRTLNSTKENGMKMLTEEHATAVASFLGEYWHEFETHCLERGLDEEDAEKAYQCLGGGDVYEGSEE